jgi:phosphate transport system permease protein
METQEQNDRAPELREPEASRPRRPNLLMSESASRLRRLAAFLGQSFLFLITSASALAVLFIILFIFKDALPYFSTGEEGSSAGLLARIKNFFFLNSWYPTAEPEEFGSVAIFYGSAMVTVGATLVAVPLGIAAAVCLSDVLPFALRQAVKPVIEILAAIPSVAYGFFALAIFAPMLQEHGGRMLATASWLVGLPLGGLAVVVLGDLGAALLPEGGRVRRAGKVTITVILSGLCLLGLYALGAKLDGLTINSGTNALNASLILGIMALPTVVSVSEDALQAVGRDMREGSYALGATRAETVIRVIIPAAGSGICAAVILGIMRAIGETMVVWMAAGNCARVPEPFYDFLQPVRTLTATIAGDMAETAHNTPHYHVLFVMALCLLIFSFGCNLISEWIVRRSRRKLRGE